ncbi:NAD(P)H-dependent oxidoreductase [Deinococcus sp. KNUC1210]|uniref:NAD(P)H-dependent oxidoreductase n=1 Tax=Deinococcus sp. KNUC1210 TaxID=2917691 RepID=UPI001EEFE6B9|nr:NAD(P)H-dependent oxidoreductase [Deinococcus sp. KNUC1210]ULH14698.1 NAD(P)H-dependent oxidoreductase [Deinococcus sp. KNUC1210]
MPRALIVHAHPEAASFCTAQMQEAARTLEARGYDVQISDLYRMDWQAALDRHDFTHLPADPFKPQAEQFRAVQGGTVASDVAAELEKLLAADLLVFSFPLWWFSLPALLKGWVDRVFAMGAVYGAGVGTYDRGRFLGRRALLLFTTGGPEGAYGPQANNGDLDTVLFHIQNGMLRFVGYTVLAPVVGHSPVRISADERAAQLSRVRAAFSTLDERATVFG